MRRAVTWAEVDEQPTIRRARADLAAGRPWKARDRLSGVLRQSPSNQPVLELLGEVLYQMGDAPAAGRVWFLTERRGPDVDEALRVFLERYGRHSIDLIRVLKVRAPIDSYPSEVRERLVTLQTEAKRERFDWQPPDQPTHSSRSRPLTAFALTALFGLILMCLAVGVMTVLGWILN